MALPITGDDDSDRLLTENPLALVVGMLLDQQVPMTWAFRGPYTLDQRLGGLDAAAVAAMDPEEFVSVCAHKPAIHRYPAAMGRRIHQICLVVDANYGGDAAAIWNDVDDAEELRRRLLELPGFGEEKTKIFIAVLAKRFGIVPLGWEAVAAPFSDGEPRSVADVDSMDSLAKVRDWKQMMKRAKRTKADDPIGADKAQA